MTEFTFTAELEKAKAGVAWLRAFNPQWFDELAVQSPDAVPPEFRLPKRQVRDLVEICQDFPLDMLDQFTPDEVHNIGSRAMRVQGLLQGFVIPEEERGDVDFVKVNSRQASMIRSWCRNLTDSMREYTARGKLMVELAKAQAILTEIRHSQAEAGSAAQAASIAAGKTGITARASVFADQAGNDNSAAKRWMRFGAGVVVVAFLFVLWGFDWLTSVDLSKVQDELEKQLFFVQALANRVLLVAIFSFVLFFCAKNYTAHRHNEVVNRHRHNAAQIYRALEELVKDSPESRAIILTQAAQTIFGPQDSGYIRGGKSGSDGISINANIPGAKGDE